MPNFYHKADTQSDMIGLNTYYKDKSGKLCQYFVTSEIMDLGLATQDCRKQLEDELNRKLELRANQAVLAVIVGGKA